VKPWLVPAAGYADADPLLAWLAVNALVRTPSTVKTTEAVPLWFAGYSNQPDVTI
jgi:hypothetical protein